MPYLDYWHHMIPYGGVIWMDKADYGVRKIEVETCTEKVTPG